MNDISAVDPKNKGESLNLDIDISKFKVVGTVNGNIICSEVSDSGMYPSMLKLEFPYWIIIEAEDPAIQFDVTYFQVDPWNTLDYILIEKDKVMFQTDVKDDFAFDFRDIMKERIKATSAAELKVSTGGNSKVVSLNDRSRFN